MVGFTPPVKICYFVDISFNIPPTTTDTILHQLTSSHPSFLLFIHFFANITQVSEVKMPYKIRVYLVWQQVVK